MRRALRACETGRPGVVHLDVEPTAHLFAPGLRCFTTMHQEPAGE